MKQDTEKIAAGMVVLHVLVTACGMLMTGIVVFVIAHFVIKYW